MNFAGIKDTGLNIWQKGMISLARSEKVKNVMQGRGAMSALSTRFVGGRAADSAAGNAWGLMEKSGILSSLFYLGGYVEDPEVIQQTLDALSEMITRLGDTGLDIHVSVDPTQIGYQVSPDLCETHAFELAGRIRDAMPTVSSRQHHLLMLDMEDLSVNQPTLDLYFKLLGASLPVAVTLQAYLFRTQKDLEKIIATGGTVRLVKGAFAESGDVAYTQSGDVDENFMNLADMMLSSEARDNGFYPVFGTHDDRMIHRIIELAVSRNWKPHEYEFEMLYGVRPAFQEILVKQGATLRLYMPFGTDWWPYAVRRVGENPKNAGFLLKAMINR